MAFDEQLADRIRTLMPPDPGVSEKKMFGGLCFLLNGHMTCGIVGDKLMVRVGKENYEATLQLPHAAIMDFTGRPMKSMVYVEPAGIVANEQLAQWIERGCSYARSLPPK